MIAFKKKDIAALPSLSERFVRQREALGIELLDAARKTSISMDYLQAIEASRYHELPGKIYGKNFVREYAKFLGLNPDTSVQRYLTEYSVFVKTNKQPDLVASHKPVERVMWNNLLVTPRIVRNFVVFLLIVVCIGYLGTRVKAIVEPPELVISTPDDNIVITENTVAVAGWVEPETTVELNGQQVVTDPEGNFTEQLFLQQGTNVIEIVAYKKHSKEQSVYRRVVVTNEGADN